MVSASKLLAFLFASLALNLTPGPGMMLTLSGTALLLGVTSSMISAQPRIAAGAPQQLQRSVE